MGIFGKKTKTEASFTDGRDGNVYKTVKIGNQIWFAENLRYYAGNAYRIAEEEKWGCYYDWDSAIAACPAGWIIPNDNDWKVLESHLGILQKDLDSTFFRGNVAHKLVGKTGLGFNALTAGVLRPDLGRIYEESTAYFWTSTECGDSSAFERHISHSRTLNEKGICRDSKPKSDCYNVRCLKA